MVEFAIAGLLFFYMLFGILDFGRAIFQYNDLASSAREGARAAIVQSLTDDQVKDYTVQASAGLLTTGDVTISGSRTCNAVPCPTVTITVQHTFTPITPLIGNLIGGSITMTASSTMVVEQ
ncbi:MAG TPA: TadE family protein [Thermomicrobiaceae bacterium]|nr:TadE family protein [Thermomicrobiaceae bacterium]